MYKNTHCDIINENDNVIIGLGDSFTQGVGAYSLETWKSISDNDPSTYNITGQHFIKEQGQNNWVRQLTKTYLPEYKTFNLGMNGGGNRSTIRELYLAHSELPKKLNNVVVILLSTGLERYDFLKKNDETAGVDWHQKWQTIFPIDPDNNNNNGRGPIAELDRAYFRHIWSERNDMLEFLFNIAEVQSYCDARGYKFLFGSVFETRVDRKQILTVLDDKKQYIDIIDWDNLIQIPNRDCFMDMINQLEGNPYRAIHEIALLSQKSKMPSKYITPCWHWTIEGQKCVAEYLFNELTKRKLI